ncbi:MAG: hypothetical protein M1834_003934 [Cirrosporium novae-zelandiae]|nr:MAG: hypothetical protein M1834_003934 [Cirrosporium novae-zelandiae]
MPSVPTITQRRYIRWLPEDPNEPTDTIVLTSSSSYFVDLRFGKGRNKKELGELEWGFAGASNSENGHGVWTHWVDSNSDMPGKDEGDMSTQLDGDTLEKGQMVNPTTGLLTKYEELWHDLEVSPVGMEKYRISAVLRLEDEGKGAQGMIVRVGQWCQGILKVGSDVTVERWSWTDSAHWEKLVKIGDNPLPCEATFSPLEGATLDFEGWKWEILESHRW